MCILNEPQIFKKASAKIMKDFNEIGIIAVEREQGQDLAEYALLVGLLALVIIVSATILGQNISGVFSSLASTVDNWW